MEKALVRFGLIGISSNSWLVVPGVFTVIDRMSKLFKELMGRNGLRDFGRDGFGSNNQGCLRKRKQGAWTCSLVTARARKAFKPPLSQITQKPRDELEGQVPVHHTCCPFLDINTKWSKEGRNAKHGLWSLKCMLMPQFYHVLPDTAKW